MVQITIIDNRVDIKTEDIDICFEGDFEIKKQGAEAPVIKVIECS